MSYRIISYHIISYHIISYHIISCYHIISHRGNLASYHIISYHDATSYHIISYNIISYHTIPYHTISYYHIIILNREGILNCSSFMARSKGFFSARNNLKSRKVQLFFVRVPFVRVSISREKQFEITKRVWILSHSWPVYSMFSNDDAPSQRRRNVDLNMNSVKWKVIRQSCSWPSCQKQTQDVVRHSPQRISISQ